MPPHPLTNFETQIYFQNESRFNGVYSRDNLLERSSTEMKDKLIELVCKRGIIMFLIFDSFGVEHIPKEVKAFVARLLSIKTNIFRIQGCDSIMC